MPQSIAEAHPLGRVPFRITVGVTGHLDLADPEAVGRAAARVFARIDSWFPTTVETPVHVEVVSSLAEGADLIVVGAALARPGTSLHAILPQHLSAYERRFTVDEREEFRSCCAKARRVDQPPPDAGEQPDYQGAGEAVVAESDLLIAVWDGNQPRGPGGTGDVAALAGAGKDRRIPVIWIDPSEAEPHAALAQWPEQSMWDDSFVEPRALPLPERLPGRLSLAWPFGSRRVGPAAQLGSFRRELMEQRAFNDKKTGGGDELRPCGPEEACREPDPGPPQEAVRVEEFCRPYFDRADRLATAYGRGYWWFIVLLFLLAAGALISAAAHQVFFPESHWEIAALEAVLLCLLLAVLAVGLILRLHSRWLAYRWLAERVRTLAYLAPLGLRARAATAIEAKYEEGSQHPWFKRAFDDIATNCPLVDDGRWTLPAARWFVRCSWICGQRTYFKSRSAALERWVRVIDVGNLSLFVATLLAAIWHARLHSATPEAVVILTLALPAAGVAIGGIRAQLELNRHARKFEAMRRLMERSERRAESASSMDELAGIADEVDEILVTENQDWFQLMHSRPPELPS